MTRKVTITAADGAQFVRQFDDQVFNAILWRMCKPHPTLLHSGSIPGLSDLIDEKAVLVPVEPTADMVEAGVKHRLTTTIGGDNIWQSDTRTLFNAMIAASPYARKT